MDVCRKGGGGVRGHLRQKDVYVYRSEQKREQGSHEAMTKKSVWLGYKARTGERGGERGREGG